MSDHRDHDRVLSVTMRTNANACLGLVTLVTLAASVSACSSKHAAAPLPSEDSSAPAPPDPRDANEPAAAPVETFPEVCAEAPRLPRDRRDAKQLGIRATWHDNGRLKATGSSESDGEWGAEDAPLGQFLVFHENGALFASGCFTTDTAGAHPVGSWRFFTTDGRIAGEGSFHRPIAMYARAMKRARDWKFGEDKQQSCPTMDSPSCRARLRPLLLELSASLKPMRLTEPSAD